MHFNWRFFSELVSEYVRLVYTLFDMRNIENYQLFCQSVLIATQLNLSVVSCSVTSCTMHVSGL
jgi:hypothetical protein